MPNVELRVNGSYYGGWKSIRIERGMEQIAGTFELSVTDRWAEHSEVRQINPGQSCQVLIDEAVVITGYVDTVAPDYDKQQHGITVSGRDKTGDLVDCAAIYKSGAWSGRTLEQIAIDLCEPFGIKVLRNVDAGTVLKPFSINEGESVFECLERAARMKAMLLVSDGLGNLVLTRANNGAAVAELVEGENILSARGEFSWKDRYSQYIVKAQGVGTDDFYGESVAQQQAESKDAAITRYRPLIVLAEDQGTGATLSQRAEWERNVRMGRGNRATVTVQGWAHDGKLWQPNTMVHVRSPRLYADLDLLIVAVTFLLDDQGTRTELQLCRREAFDVVTGVSANKLDAKLKGKQDHQKKGKKSEDWSL